MDLIFKEDIKLGGDEEGEMNLRRVWRQSGRAVKFSKYIV